MTEARPLTVGLVGTGRMGGSMARALGRAGFPLVVHNRTPERAQALADEVGARVAASPAETASLADVTITMLADDAAVEHVYGGPQGLIAGPPRGRRARRHEHDHAGHDPGARGARDRAPAAVSSTPR